jgi:hypothetical protein
LPTILSFLSGRQITNDSGVPQAGAKLLHYREGTTTALTVWTNDAASVAHAQPVVCDAGGFVPLIYVDDTFDWKVVVTTSGGVILKTYDNLPKAETDESAVGFAPPLFPWEQVTSAASPLTLTVNDVGNAYEFDTTGGSITVNLPDAASVGSGKGFVFKRTAAANSVTLDPSGSQTIDDATTFVMTQLHEVVGIFSNGAEWYKVFSHLPNVATVQRFTSGSGTYTPPAGLRYVRVRMLAGGGGGGAIATNAGVTGTTSSFSTWTAIGGTGGAAAAGAGAAGGAGGTGGTDGTGTLIVRLRGGQGSGTASGAVLSSSGGSTALGGGAPAVQNDAGGAGIAAYANSGGGGSGGVDGGVGAGAGGGGGEYVEFLMTAAQIGASVAYVVGPGGAGGAAGTQAGGNGGSGVIIVDEYY